MATIAPELAPLSAAERRWLLDVARRSIRSALLGEPLPPLAEGLTPALEEARGAFVTLRYDGQLRGCIGSILADEPLHETVRRVARSAAFNDPRFAPLTPAELPDLEIEISRLSAMVEVPPQAVVPGVHGVSIQYRGHRAVFLPKVAQVQGWDRETLLSELCLKAALGPDAWRNREAEVSVFTAEVFSDREERHRSARTPR